MPQRDGPAAPVLRHAPVSLVAPLLTALLLSQDQAPLPPPPPPPTAPELGAPSEPSTPPLVPVPPPPAKKRSSGYQPTAVVPQPPDVPTKGAVLFSPLSLFGLFLSVEVEYAFLTQLAAYGAIGAGAFAQVAGEAGLRYYPVERALDSVFVELHGQFFTTPISGLTLVGPGAMIGFDWKARAGASMMSSAGVGVNVWFETSSPSAAFLGSRPSPGGFILFPGIQVPPFGGSAVQLTVRFCLGPVF